MVLVVSSHVPHDLFKVLTFLSLKFSVFFIETAVRYSVNNSLELVRTSLLNFKVCHVEGSILRQFFMSN